MLAGQLGEQLSTLFVERKSHGRPALLIDGSFDLRQILAGDVLGVGNDQDLRHLATVLLLRANGDVAIAGESPRLGLGDRHPPGQPLTGGVENLVFGCVLLGMFDEVLVVVRAGGCELRRPGRAKSRLTRSRLASSGWGKIT